MELKNSLLAATLAAVLAVVGAVVFIGVGQDGRDGMNGADGVGGFAGPDISVRTVFESGMSEGGGTVITATSTQDAATLTDYDMANSKVIVIAAGDTPALALTLPASTTWPSLNKPYEAQEWVIDNLHTNAATTTTITAGTGVDIDGDTANDDVINGGVSATLMCWRLLTGDIRCQVSEKVDAG